MSRQQKPAMDPVILVFPGIGLVTIAVSIVHMRINIVRQSRGSLVE
jgi:hypothetical protein